MVEKKTAKLVPNKILASLNFKFEKYKCNTKNLGFTDSNFVPYTLI